MRPIVVVGIVLVLGGLFVVLKNVPYTSERHVMKFGDMEATVEERHTIPPWLGIAAIVGGVVLLGAARRPPASGNTDSRA